MSGAWGIWLLAGMGIGFGAAWVMRGRKDAATATALEQEIDMLQRDLSDCLAATADRDARIATLEAELELAPPHDTERAVRAR